MRFFQLWQFNVNLEVGYQLDIDGEPIALVRTKAQLAWDSMRIRCTEVRSFCKITNL